MTNARRRRALLSVIATALVAMLVPAGLARGVGLLSNATAGSKKAVATSIAVPPPVVTTIVGDTEPVPAIGVSQSETGYEGPSWSALKVGDQVVIGKRIEDGDSAWDGALAGLGGVVDGVNDEYADCQFIEFAVYCLSVLESGGYRYYGDDRYEESYAYGTIAHVFAATEAAGEEVVLIIAVAPSEASFYGYPDGFHCTSAASKVAFVRLIVGQYVKARAEADPSADYNRCYGDD